MTAAAVTDADAIDDAEWFAANPTRNYRLRPGGWSIRRYRGVFLRCLTEAKAADEGGEDAAARAWWSAAYPGEAADRIATRRPRRVQK